MMRSQGTRRCSIGKQHRPYNPPHVTHQSRAEEGRRYRDDHGTLSRDLEIETTIGATLVAHGGGHMRSEQKNAAAAAQV
ncbi:MAG: hypothetical protein ACE10G_04660 [Gemmatimonadales bacterium]